MTAIKNEDARLLLKVLETEISGGCLNRAVFGGFDRFFVKRAKALADTRPDIVPLVEKMKDYEKMPVKARMSLNARLRPILEQFLTGKVDGSLDSPVCELKGVGPKSTRQLASLGIETRMDLLRHFPYRYEDRRELRQIGTLSPGDFAGILADISRVSVRRAFRGRKAVFEAVAEDGSGSISLVFFNQPYLKKILRPGVTAVFFGKVTDRLNKLQMLSPDFEIVRKGARQETVGYILPFYRLCQGLSQKKLRNLVRRELAAWAHRLEETLPESLVEKYRFPSTSDALFGIHRPDTMADIEEARRRLVYEEFFLLQVSLAVKKHFFTRELPGIAIPDKNNAVGRLKDQLPFSFTRAQERALKSILDDLSSCRAMSRLLQGEVGSGKTVVALAAMLVAAAAGFQSAIMAPTEILAEQHFLNIKDLCSRLGVSVELLVGRMPRRKRNEVLERLSSGKALVVVGTHALIQDEVRYSRLGLVIVDEQHRFGVAQRSRLRHKGRNPNLLVMTATPIPRTLCMTLYGDLDVSVLDEMPKGRAGVTTRWCRSRELESIYRAIDKELSAGRQAFIVCPRIEPGKSSETAWSAVEAHDFLSTTRFPRYNVLLLHGRMQTAEKETVMKAVRDGSCDLLVSTTVIEVGIDISNATIMLVLAAERFGLAQLHQLRGRVGRASLPSTCYLVSDAAHDEAVERLEALVTTNNGFKVAEEDLRIRGPGEFFGTRQSGLPELKVADLFRDLRVLEQAREDAFALVGDDPGLARPENEGLRKALQRSFRHHIYFRS